MHVLRVVTQILYVYIWFSSGLLFGRRPENPLVVQRADIQTACGSWVWRGIQAPYNPPSLFHLHTKRCPAVPSTISRLCVDSSTVTLITLSNRLKEREDFSWLLLLVIYISGWKWHLLMQKNDNILLWCILCRYSLYKVQLSKSTLAKI